MALFLHQLLSVKISHFRSQYLNLISTTKCNSKCVLKTPNTTQSKGKKHPDLSSAAEQHWKQELYKLENRHFTYSTATLFFTLFFNRSCCSILNWSHKISSINLSENYKIFIALYVFAELYSSQLKQTEVSLDHWTTTYEERLVWLFSFSKNLKHVSEAVGFSFFKTYFKTYCGERWEEKL